LDNNLSITELPGTLTSSGGFVGENITCHNLNRLDNVYIGSTMTLDMSYNNDKAGISSKSHLGTLIYEAPDNPYAVSGINPLTGLIPFTAQDITYTSFEKV